MLVASPSLRHVPQMPLRPRRQHLIIRHQRHHGLSRRLCLERVTVSVLVGSFDGLVGCLHVCWFVCLCVGSKYDSVASRNPATSGEWQPCHNEHMRRVCVNSRFRDAFCGVLWLFLSCMCCNLPICSSNLLAAAAGSTLQHMLRWRPSGHRRDPFPLCAL